MYKYSGVDIVNEILYTMPKEAYKSPFADLVLDLPISAIQK
jgi:hypothetical protein